MKKLDNSNGMSKETCSLTNDAKNDILHINWIGEYVIAWGIYLATRMADGSVYKGFPPPFFVDQEMINPDTMTGSMTLAEIEGTWHNRNNELVLPIEHKIMIHSSRVSYYLQTRISSRLPERSVRAFMEYVCLHEILHYNQLQDVWCRHVTEFFNDESDGNNAYKTISTFLEKEFHSYKNERYIAKMAINGLERMYSVFADRDDITIGSIADTRYRKTIPEWADVWNMLDYIQCMCQIAYAEPDENVEEVRSRQAALARELKQAGETHGSPYLFYNS